MWNGGDEWRKKGGEGKERGVGERREEWDGWMRGCVVVGRKKEKKRAAGVNLNEY